MRPALLHDLPTKSFTWTSLNIEKSKLLRHKFPLHMLLASPEWFRAERAQPLRCSSSDRMAFCRTWRPPTSEHLKYQIIVTSWIIKISQISYRKPRHHFSTRILCNWELRAAPIWLGISCHQNWCTDRLKRIAPDQNRRLWRCFPIQRDNFWLLDRGECSYDAPNMTFPCRPTNGSNREGLENVAKIVQATNLYAHVKQ